MAKQVKTKSGECRINKLPDVVLCRILSFLPTIEAVRTSILSIKWRYLFASSPKLDFDDMLFLSQKGDRRVNSFMNFVDRVLFFHKMSRIERFQLSCSHGVDSSRIYGWISAALWHNLEELDLCISSTDKFISLPVGLFTCKLLVVLKLDSCLVLNVPTNVCFPSLKTLHLKSIEFPNDDSVQRLFSGCLVLEALLLDSCNCRNISKFSILNPTLKRLTINFLSGRYEPSHSLGIVIDTPSLVYFRCIDHIADNYSLLNMHSLVEVDIYFYLDQDRTYCSDHQLAAIGFLRSIVSVQSLIISNEDLLLFSYKPVPLFDKLIYLEIVFVHTSPEWIGFADILENSPNLETLVFHELVNLRNLFRHLPRKVPCCLLSHLKEVEMCSFRGEKDQMELIKYFLKSGRVLEKLIIYMNVELETEELKITKELLKLPRGSNKCQVQII